MTRIVVTGVGCISALGNDYNAFAENLMKGVCGIGPIRQHDTSRLLVKVAAEVKDYDARMHFGEQQRAQMDRFAQFAVLTARQAVADAGLDPGGPLSGRTAVVYGTGVGGQVAHDESYRLFYGEKAKRLHPFSVPRVMPSAGASHISMDLGITGPVFGTVGACASAGHAIAVGALMLRGGMAEVVLAGGSEACLTPGTLKAWEGLRVMAKDTCRPFSTGRGGMVLGEGAGTLVFESLERARKRGARIYGELAGVSVNADAGSLTAPREESITQAIRMALEDAGITPDRVEYINAHGTGTGQNDSTECRAIHAVFGERGKHLPVSSSKSMFGHTLGAGSALEAIATLAAIRKQTAPPTLGYLGPDPNCEIDCVPNAARPVKIVHALSNSFAFGGLNTVLAFRNLG